MAAKGQGAKHIFVAGDVWDSALPSNTNLRQPLTVMGEYPDLTWWLLPGNHDPDGPDGLWDRVESLAPENVKSLRHQKPVEIETGVFVLPAPWQRIQHGQDLTSWMDGAETPQGAFRIGLAHGSVQGFGTEGDTDREIISPERVERAALDYLALGDWHAQKQVNPRSYYPGTPEPDRHKTGSRGQVLAVTLHKGATPEVKAISTAQYDWPVISASLQAEEVNVEFKKIRETLEEGQPLRRTYAQLHLSGEVSVGEWSEVETFLESLTGECASLDIRGQGDLRLIVIPEDIDALDTQGSVRDTAQTLLKRRDDADLSKEDRAIAEDALRLLLRYGAETA